MRTALHPLVLLGSLSLLAGCGHSPMIEPEAALDANSVEFQIDSDGEIVEVEYHVPPTMVPAAVREAMQRMNPAGRIVDAERELNDGELYWEVAMDVGGRKCESMFLPDGTLHSEENEIGREAVPPPVWNAVAAAWGGGTFTSWEEIRDGRRRIVEYHAKIERDAKKYKVLVAPDGRILGAVREVPAEIEVPVGR